MIFDDCCTNSFAGKLLVLSEFSVFPICQSFRSTDPKRPVASAEQAENSAGRELLTRRWLPGNGPDAIKAKQTKLGTQPEIPVGCLSDRADDAFGKAVADLPRRVRVLANVKVWIQSERTREAGQR